MLSQIHEQVWLASTMVLRMGCGFIDRAQEPNAMRSGMPWTASTPLTGALAAQPICRTTATSQILSIVSEAPVRVHRDLLSNSRCSAGVQLGEAKALAISTLSHHRTPGVNDQRVTV